MHAQNLGARGRSICPDDIWLRLEIRGYVETLVIVDPQNVGTMCTLKMRNWCESRIRGCAVENPHTRAQAVPETPRKMLVLFVVGVCWR